MNLDSSLEKVRGVGPKTLEKLAAANLRTVGDILAFFPRKHEDFASLTNLSEIRPGKVLFRARAEKVSSRRVRRGMVVVEAVLADGKDKIKAVWFNQAYRVAQLKSGDEFYFSGEFSFSYNRYQLTNPRVMKREELPSSQNFEGEAGEIVPIYRQIKGLKTEVVRKILLELKPMMKILPETLPALIVSRENLISRAEAIEWAHFPPSGEHFEKALARLSFEEIFEIIFASKLNKMDNEKLEGWQIPFDLEAVKKFTDLLKFDLTNSQRMASWEIIQDMKLGTPMNRLLQGDVGSGKTMVAILAALNAARAGFQVAVLAPTEILASQLAENFANNLLGQNLRVAFLSSSIKGVSKKQLYADLEAGKINILVGTHAIIQEKVKFKKLGLVVIDEQHRFGVSQRQKLLEKSRQKMPHLLAMTATPIPRSLQLTLFGDLSVSVLREKPKGRKPILTEIISPVSRTPMVAKIKDEISKGRQAFVIVPAIRESSNDEIKSIETEFRRLKKEFSGLRIAQLHGKMPAEEKDAVMADFLAKKSDILLSTTVIEVGVDVPNASVMVIENADRFGLSQLHQLRGRVGRGGADAFCYLVMSGTSKPPERLLEIEKTDDGFALAEKDLALRGPGEIYGKAQSGELRLEFASLGDTETISRAQSAVDLLAENSTEFEKYLHTRQSSLKKYQRLTVLN
ncbi:MAG: ATP-dependent DNA helicase RecG [bacterium]|nr:ATP-dependent DNA helicase RecG [bacterium]